MLEIGIQSRGIIRETVIEEGYRRIRQSGMTCVDYNLIISEEESFDSDIAHFKKHKECAKKYGLRFSQVHAPILKYDLESPQKVRDIADIMKKSIEICEMLESPYLVLHPFALAFALGKEEEKRINLEFFQELAETAVLHKVIICIENMPCKKWGRLWESACSDAESLSDYIDILNEKAGVDCFGACFDVGHANVLGKNLKEEVKRLGRRLKVLHVHDNDGISDSHQVPYGFSGAKSGMCTTDWSGFLLGLREIGYQGAVSFETYKALVNVPGVLQEVLLEYLYKIGANFAKIISYEDTLRKKAAKEVILFGAGKMLDVYMHEFGGKFPPSFAVDNNAALWGSKKCGIPIRSPREILLIPEEKRHIILCSMYYEEIGVQLQEMGIRQFELSEEILRMNGKPL